jgi:CMP-2-keto-3-deoxyoctulosonic acid synthetase
MMHSHDLKKSLQSLMEHYSLDATKVNAMESLEQINALLNGMTKISSIVLLTA